MATTHLVTLEQYLHSAAFERCEYDGGIVTEKPMSTWKHSKLCGWLGALIFRFYPQYVAGPEVRSRLDADLWKLPDVLVALTEQTNEEYATVPPHLCVEVLSKDDTLEAMFDKCSQYHAWGVPYCWILDPEKLMAWQLTRGEQPRQEEGQLNAEPIRFDVDVLFSCLQKKFRADLLKS